MGSPQAATTAPSVPSFAREYGTLVASEGAPRVVLIDLFDTIIGRRVEPEYVKAIWAKRIRYAAGINASAADIHAMRVAVEAELCQQNVRAGFDDEFRFLDMCNEIFTRLDASEEISARMTRGHFSGICEEVEWGIEREVQFVYPTMRSFLTELRQNKVDVYIVSDTFFSTRQMRGILQHHQLDSIVSGFFISSETLVAKRSGRLFERVLGSLNVPGRESLMLGDNPISDIANSAKHGIRSILVEHGISDESRLGIPSAQTRLDAGFKKITKPTSSIFPEMALSLYAFTARLFQRAVQLGAQDLLFCSREGLLLKDLFDQYQKQLGLSHTIRSHYFYTSRLSSFLPSLGPLETESFERLFRQYRTLSLKTFLLNLQFPEKAIEEIAHVLNVVADETVNDFPNSAVFTKLRELPLFAETYETLRQEQRDNATTYLKGFYPSGILPQNVVLVDVGWKGTIQDNIRCILPDDVDLHGLYVGLVAPGAVSNTNRKEGLLFSVLPTKSPYFDAFFESCALFEIFLSAQHPGTTRYIRQGSSVTPELGGDEKSAPIRDRLEALQIAYRVTCEHLFDTWRLNHLDELDTLKSVAIHHGRMVFYPSKEELEIVASQEHYENFGVFNHTNFWLPERVPTTDFLKHFARFLKNPQSVLASSLWPALSLARHGLDCLQPWYARKKMKKIFRHVSR